MAGWQRHQGMAIALDRENVDTDQLIPARLMSTPRSEGYGPFLLHDMRRDTEGALLPDAPLNAHPEASILITGRNFGSGSSREAAVYALVDFGIRVVVAPSFGDIFASNAINNGLLPARVDCTEILLEQLAQGPLSGSADLQTQIITIGDTELPFQIDPVWREKLIKGWDDIDLTQAHHAEIATYRAQRRKAAPWAFATKQNETGDQTRDP